MHWLCPAGVYMPGGQLVQLAAVALEAVPEGHIWQVAEPCRE